MISCAWNKYSKHVAVHLLIFQVNGEVVLVMYVPDLMKKNVRVAFEECRLHVHFKTGSVLCRLISVLFEKNLIELTIIHAYPL